jgi:DNA-binding protein H-NS
MASYQDLLKQREALEKQIAEARQRETADAVAKVRALMAEYGLTASDVFPSGKTRGGKPTAKVAPKYRDPATGATWTGRGKAPRWIAGKDRAKFLIG